MGWYVPAASLPDVAYGCHTCHLSFTQSVDLSFRLVWSIRRMRMLLSRSMLISQYFVQISLKC